MPPPTPGLCRNGAPTTKSSFLKIKPYCIFNCYRLGIVIVGEVSARYPQVAKGWALFSPFFFWSSLLSTNECVMATMVDGVGNRQKITLRISGLDEDTLSTSDNLCNMLTYHHWGQSKQYRIQILNRTACQLSCFQVWLWACHCLEKTSTLHPPYWIVVLLSHMFCVQVCSQS